MDYMTVFLLGFILGQVATLRSIFLLLEAKEALVDEME